MKVRHFWRLMSAGQVDAGNVALGVGALAFVGLHLLMRAFPQRPDGDTTALAQFAARYGAGWPHTLRDGWWLHLAGALLAWGLLARLLHSLATPHPTRPARTLFWLGLLLAWSGWAWNQSRGWQGELFLEPGVATPLGVDRAPVVAFERFLVPPAPDGPGRALALRLRVAGQSHDLTELAPYRGASWTLQPRWYGATVRAPALAEPLFFGGDGTQRATLRGGGASTVTVDAETLAVHSDPPLAELRAAHHAILRARFAPGDPLLRAGLAVAALGALGWLALRLRRRPPGSR